MSDFKPSSDRDVESVLTRAVALIREQSPLAQALGRRNVTLQYQVFGLDSVVTLSSHGATVDSAGTVPETLGRLVTVTVDRETSHQILTKQLSIPSARYHQLLKVRGTREQLGWVLAYLEPIHSEYLKAIGEARE